MSHLNMVKMGQKTAYSPPLVTCNDDKYSWKHGGSG